MPSSWNSTPLPTHGIEVYTTCIFFGSYCMVQRQSFVYCSIVGLLDNVHRYMSDPSSGTSGADLSSGTEFFMLQFQSYRVKNEVILSRKYARLVILKTFTFCPIFPDWECLQNCSTPCWKDLLLIFPSSGRLYLYHIWLVVHSQTGKHKNGNFIVQLTWQFYHSD